MPQYVLKPSGFQTGQVGGLYHIGLSDGVNQYGYVLQNQGPQSGFTEETNIADKDKLIQYSSPNLIDRDLVFYPRVTQGDFSGGGLQAVFSDPTKYFDSDLEIRTPGYLTLRPGWVRTLHTTTAATTPQAVAWNNDVWTCFGENSAYYSSSGTKFTGAAMTCKFIDTDGNSLILADGVGNVKGTTNNSTYYIINNTAVTMNQIWLVNQGTNGRFLYYANDTGATHPPGTSENANLFRIDMTAIPSAGVAMALNLTQFNIVDLCEYQNGIAMLTNDPGGTGFDVWYHDGVNMVRIVRVNQYTGVGIVPCLGDLYVTGQSTGGFEAPVLMHVTTGNYEVVVRTSSPLATLTSATIGAPESSGQYVAFALLNPQLNGVTTTGYIGIYDAVTGAYSHLGNLDTLDAPLVAQPRQLAFNGRAVTLPSLSGTTGTLQTQTNSSRLPAGNAYTGSGTVVGSKYDFGTPGIPKRFRRIEAVHNKPLATGESVQIKMFVDQDPVGYTAALTPTATVTNSTVGSTLTQLTAGADTVGRTLYPVAVLRGPGTSTPSVNRIAVEIGGTYTWALDLDCTNLRRLLNQATIDPQGVTGKDLYFLLRNAYENGTLLTLFLAEGVSYTVTIESLKAHAPGYVDHQEAHVKADEEWLVSAVLKQVA